LPSLLSPSSKSSSCTAVYTRPAAPAAVRVRTGRRLAAAGPARGEPRIAAHVRPRAPGAESSERSCVSLTQSCSKRAVEDFVPGVEVLSIPVTRCLLLHSTTSRFFKNIYLALSLYLFTSPLPCPCVAKAFVVAHKPSKWGTARLTSRLTNRLTSLWGDKADSSRGESFTRAASPPQAESGSLFASPGSLLSRGTAFG